MKVSQQPTADSKNKRLRVVCFGTSTFAIPTLEALHRNPEWQIVAVVTTPPARVGREQKLESSPTSLEAKALGIKVLEPDDLSSLKWIEEFTSLCPELAVVASYGKIIPESNLLIPKFGFINIHPSLLPKYRGASPVESVILNEEAETGVTIIKMDNKVDQGPILSQTVVKIAGDEYAYELEEKLAKIGADLLIKTIPSYVHRKIVPQEQDHAKATFTKKITREDGRVELNWPGDMIWKMYRAFHPWPGIWTVLRIKDKEIRIKLIHIELIAGKIKITKVQPEGKKPMTMDEFTRGYPNILETNYQ